MRHPDGLLRVHTYYTMSMGDAWSETPSEAYGEDISELRRDPERMLAALDKPILDY